MRLLTLNIKIIISTSFFLILFRINGISQGTDMSYVRQNHFFLGVNVSPSRTGIVNNGISTISKLSSVRKNSFCGSIDAGYMFSKYFGLSTGLGLNSYVTGLLLQTYLNSYDTTDSEQMTYNRRISGDNIKETQKISFLNIPLLVNVQLPLNSTFGFYARAGVNLLFPVSKIYSSTGTFTYSGYYTAYNVLLTDIPYEGFQSNVTNNVNGELKIRAICEEFTSSAGFHFFLNKNAQFSLGVVYNKLLTDISGYSLAPNYRLSTKKDHVRSMMEGSNNVSASSIGIQVSFRYFLK